jgi:hypothetical protein
MKINFRIIVLFSFVLFFASFQGNTTDRQRMDIVAPLSDFCEGWKDGYKSGWCFERAYGCLSPLVPLCPLQNIGEKTYKDGYNRGFVQALKDRQ